ncbi:MAG TPA: hypothetical protein VIO16_05815 [Dehalococcoidia bacterium]
MLCTDGVHGVLEDHELAELVQGPELQAAVKRVLALVDERRGRDDATLVIVELAGEMLIEEAPPPGRSGFFPSLFRLFRRR